MQMLHPVASRPGLRRPWLDEMSYGRLKLSSHGAFGIHRSPAGVRVTLTKQPVVGESSGRKQSTDPDYPQWGQHLEDLSLAAGQTSQLADVCDHFRGSRSGADGNRACSRRGLQT